MGLIFFKFMLDSYRRLYYLINIKVQSGVLSAKRYINLLKPDAHKGFYAFSKPITPPPQSWEGEIINTILSNPLKLKAKTQTVYVYDSNTMELIINLLILLKNYVLFLKIAKHIAQYYIHTEKPTLLNVKFC